MEYVTNYIQDNQTFFIVYGLLLPPVMWGLWKYVKATTPPVESFDEDYDYEANGYEVRYLDDAN
jgi:hypothetical protein